MKNICFLTVLGLTFVDATVYFEERFDEGWQDRWVESTYKGKEAGKFIWSAGKFYGDKEINKGIQTSQDRKYYSLSARFAKFSNKGKELVIQFTVKHEQNIDCGGGYVKLFRSDLDQKNMHGESIFHIMFGPDMCGLGNRKIHVIFNYQGQHLHTKKVMRLKNDVFTHMYTLIVRPDNTYEVRVDNARVESGSLKKDLGVVTPKNVSYDIDEDDEDGDIDGDLDPVTVGHEGHIEHTIESPGFGADVDLYKYDDIGVIGFDVWQIKSGTIFDNVLITDDLRYAEKVGRETWKATKEAEEKMKKRRDRKIKRQIEKDKASKKKKEKKKRKAEKKNKKAEGKKANAGEKLVKASDKKAKAGEKLTKASDKKANAGDKLPNASDKKRTGIKVDYQHSEL